MIVKRIGPMSLAKLSGVLYGIVGLVGGAVVSLIALAGGFASDSAAGTGIGAVVGIAAVVVLPLGYGLLGFLSSLLGAWCYNVLADLVGGVEVDLQ